MEEEIIQAFRQFDVDGDGTLTFDELLHVMDTIAPGTFSVDDMVCVFDQMDINADESIEYEEFVHWCCTEGEGQVVDTILELASCAAEDISSEYQPSFPVSDEHVYMRAPSPVHTELIPFRREGLGFEGGGYKIEHDGGFVEVSGSAGYVAKAKHGHDGDVVEMGINLGIGVSIKEGINIGTDGRQRAQVTFGMGAGAGMGFASKGGIDATGASIVEASAAGFGLGFSFGGDHTFAINLKVCGYDIGFKLTLKGLYPTNARERKDLQSTYKPKLFRNTMTAAKNYAKGQIKKDKKHRFCTITEWAAVPASHFTVKVYDVSDDYPASFATCDGHHEILYDTDEFLSKDYAEGEFLKINERSCRETRAGLTARLMNQVGYTEDISDFMIVPFENMIMLKFHALYVTFDGSEVILSPEGTAFKVRPVEDSSGRFVLEPNGHPGNFIGRSDNTVVGVTRDVRKAQMRAIPLCERKGFELPLYAIRFGG